MGTFDEKLPISLNQKVKVPELFLRSDKADVRDSRETLFVINWNDFAVSEKLIVSVSAKFDSKCQFDKNVQYNFLLFYLVFSLETEKRFR